MYVGTSVYILRSLVWSSYDKRELYVLYEGGHMMVTLKRILALASPKYILVRIETP